MRIALPADDSGYQSCAGVAAAVAVVCDNPDWFVANVDRIAIEPPNRFERKVLTSTAPFSGVLLTDMTTHRGSDDGKIRKAAIR